MKVSLTNCREVRYGIALQPFFVTGLPRSRTAWLANLLTTDVTICHHDLPFSIGAVSSERLTGFSGPQLCTQFAEVCRFFPNAPWLIVLREQAEALEAFCRVRDKHDPDVGLPIGYWQDRCHLISSLCAHHQAMTVNFDELDRESVMRPAWAHLLPGIPFDVERFRLLCGMNIQQRVPNGFAASTAH